MGTGTKHHARIELLITGTVAQVISKCRINFQVKIRRASNSDIKTALPNNFLHKSTVAKVVFDVSEFKPFNGSKVFIYLFLPYFESVVLITHDRCDNSPGGSTSKSIQNSTTFRTSVAQQYPLD